MPTIQPPPSETAIAKALAERGLAPEESEMALDAVIDEMFITGNPNTKADELVRIAFEPFRLTPKDRLGRPACAVLQTAILHPNFPLDRLSEAIARFEAEGPECQVDLYAIRDRLHPAGFVFLTLSGSMSPTDFAYALLLDDDHDRRRIRFRAILDAIPLFDLRKAHWTLHECLQLALDHYGAGDGASAQERLEMKIKLALLKPRDNRPGSPA